MFLLRWEYLKPYFLFQVYLIHFVTKVWCHPTFVIKTDQLWVTVMHLTWCWSFFPSADDWHERRTVGWCIFNSSRTFSGNNPGVRGTTTRSAGNVDEVGLSNTSFWGLCVILPFCNSWSCECWWGDLLFFLFQVHLKELNSLLFGMFNTCDYY